MTLRLGAESSAVALPAGMQFGPYELLGPLGSGGMGEVLRARDPRLGREVAIKILRRDVVTDRGRVLRFQQEARAASALNHPNVLAIFDVGEHDGLPFVVTELLEGETLRARIQRAPVPPRKALDIALQIARGLAAAHQKGIVHRDLKPENIFLTKDGRAKILDFGLAKLVEGTAPSPGLASPPDANPGTEPGMLLGTAGYMAPEQVRGEPADARSDIFALGALLYEMLGGKRAFDGPTRIAVLYGILLSDPPELDPRGDLLTENLTTVLEHCMEKRPEDRFQSARDLAFQLEFLTTGSSLSSGRVRKLQPEKRLTLRRTVVAAALAATLAAGALGGAFLARRLLEKPPPRFTQLSFRRGAIRSARFVPGGRDVVYSGAFDGQPMQLYAASAGSVESRPLGFSQADVFGISRARELALALRLRPGPSSYVRMGTLARVPLAGGSPRELVENVQFADWAGDDLALIRQERGKYRLELPPGRVLAETDGWFSHVRVSPKGDAVAFIEHGLYYGDDRGNVVVLDRKGTRRFSSAEYASAQGLAWRGTEVWFTASDGIGRSLRAISEVGAERVVLTAPATLLLYDIAEDGKVLLGRSSARAGLVGRSDDGSERDLSWLDYSIATGLSADAGLFSFFEAGEGGGAAGSAYVRKLDGTPAIKLGQGYAWDLSRDGKLAVLFTPTLPGRLRLVPTGVGETATLDLSALERISGARFLDGKVLIVSGNLKGHGAQLFRADGASLVPFTPEGMGSVFYTVAPVSPDGKRVLAQAAGDSYAVHAIDGKSPPLQLPLSQAERPQGWAGPDAIYVHRPRELPQRIDRLELSSQRRERVAEFSPSDRAGVEQVGPVFVDGRGRVVLYGYVRTLDELYVVEGLR